MGFNLEMQRIVQQCRPGLIGSTSNPSRNLITAIQELKQSPRLLSQFQEESNQTLMSLDYVRALTRSGLAVEQGFFRELFKQIEYTFLPRALDETDALDLVGKLFSSRGSMDWVQYIDEDVLSDFLQLLVKDRNAFIEKIAPQLFESLEILSLRLAACGVEERIYDRLESRPDLRDALISVQRITQKLFDKPSLESIAKIEESLDLCDQAVEFIRSERTVKGISIALTFRLVRIQELCSRIQKILHVLRRILGEWDILPTTLLVKDILVSETQKIDIGNFFSKHFELLAYEITEHTGRAGEHYITTTKSEWKAMFKSAAIGGVIVGFLALIKAMAGSVGFPPALEALVFGTIYAVGFLVIHNIGGTIATKQPAMTASKIAAALDAGTSSAQAMMNLADLVVKTIRSQLVAVLGNYLIAFPTACLVSLPFIYLGIPLISNHKAHALLDSLDPFTSLSFWYAAVAGVCLFVSGVLGGMANNWFVFNEIGKRLRSSSFLGFFTDAQKLDYMVQKVDHNIGHWVGNASLGFFLGGMGFVGFLFGLPLDIRHISFASAQAGAALAHLDFTVTFGYALIIMIGVFVMGLINLAVSFSLTLMLVIKSRKIHFSKGGELIWLCINKFRTRPLDFFIPPK